MSDNTQFVSEKILPPPEDIDGITDPIKGKYRYYSDGETEFQRFEETWRCPKDGTFVNQDIRGCYH